ncbi:MAG: DUF4178 domain-containing protein [Bacteroidia bacterium]
MAGSDFKPYTSKGVKAFSCPNCGGQVEVRAPGQSLTAVCGFCRTVIDPNDPNYKILQKANDAKARKPKIPLGHRGQFDGIEWETIGFMVRLNTKYNHEWEEYLLFNPIHGFRFLIQDSGHWTLSKSTLKPAIRGRNNSYMNFNGQHFKRFVSGKARVVYVEGEFYWNVKRGDEVDTVDYVDPPFMLSGEFGGREESWSMGSYMKPSKIKEGFGKEAKTGYKTGIGANQPNPAKPIFNQILPIWVVLAAALTVMQFMFVGTSNKEKVFTTNNSTNIEKLEVKSDTVLINGKTSNLEVSLTSSVSNQWVEIEGTLTALKGELEYGFLVGNSYYYGVSGGESWSEGDKKKSRVMNNVEPGKYLLKYTIYSPLKNSQQKISYALNLTRDVPIWSNYILFIVLLSIPVILLFMWQSSFESSRWES